MPTNNTPSREETAQVGGSSIAVVDRKEAGPQFGADGLKILLQDGRQRCAQSRLGRSPPLLSAMESCAL